jgi:hypothetical protein
MQMNYNLALILALLLPALLFIFLRVNAAFVFLSVCLGAVLVDHVGNQAHDMLGLFAPKVNSASRTAVDLALLLTPVVLTTIVMVLSVRGKWKVILNAVPAIAASMLMVILAVPLLSRGLSFNLMHQPVWNALSKAEALVVGLGALVSLFFLWLGRASFRSKHDKKKH